MNIRSVVDRIVAMEAENRSLSLENGQLHNQLVTAVVANASVALVNRGDQSSTKNNGNSATVDSVASSTESELVHLNRTTLDSEASELRHQVDELNRIITGNTK